MTQHDPAVLIANLRRPAKGTKVGDVFDRLIASVGNPVRLRGCNTELRQLEDHYGLRLTRRGDGRYILRGIIHTDCYTDLRTGKVSRVADLSPAEFERIFSNAR